jgi:hypothetical protein
VSKKPVPHSPHYPEFSGAKTVSLALTDILAEHWHTYACANRNHLSAAHYRAVRRVLACRTAELGGRLYRCDGCATPHFAYHSCNHRSCPQCGSLEQQLWTAKQEAKLLPVPYFMVTFTIPAELRQACLAHPKELYATILKQSANALRDTTHTKTKGGITGFTSVLHTWGRQLQHHPHVHCIVPALAWQPEKKLLIHPKEETFLIHYAPLAARFRNLMRLALQSDHPEIYKNLPSTAKATFLPTKTWNVQLQHVGRGNTAIRYLARYVKRSAIGPHRLIGYDKQGNIRLHWTNSNTNKPGILTLSPHELIRRWLIHVLPKGFARVRHYGFMSSAAGKTLQAIRLHLGIDPTPELILPEPTPHTCPCCGGILTFLCEIAPIYPLRAPPRKQSTQTQCI